MANKDIKEITERLEQGVKEVFSSAKYIEFLRFMSRFTDYSVSNMILIMMQRPDASLVAGYKSWQQKGRQVRKGEKAIKIIAPCPHKKDMETDDGETKEIIWTSFRPVSVFDISQTDGEDIPTGCVEMLTGDVDSYDTLLEKLIKAAPVPVEFEDIAGGANGFYSQTEKRIAVQNGMSQQQTVKTLIHELSHAVLHDSETGQERETDRGTREVQAESVAYTVCSMLGIDASDYSFGYVAGWSAGKEVKELKASMETIRETSGKIYDALAL